ncbi:TPA: hypothetical protein DIV55_02660 [Patescibacteria group bacterium]|nr:hypothetical protein [Patescibacteria group bacterium]
MIARNTQILSVSLPKEIMADVEKMAKIERRSKSDLIREMIQLYRSWKFKRDWKKIRAMGEDIRKKFNFKNEDELFEYIHGD